MSNNARYTYPPVQGPIPQFSDPPVIAAPSRIEDDPRFMAFIQEIVGRQTQQLENSFRQELATREDTYNKRQHESDLREAGLHAEIQKLSERLQAVMVVPPHSLQLPAVSSEPLLINHDSVMNDDNDNEQASQPRTMGTHLPVVESHRLDTPGQKKPTARRKKSTPTTPIPGSSPAHNLRSRTQGRNQAARANADEPASSNIIPLPLPRNSPRHARRASSPNSQTVPTPTPMPVAPRVDKTKKRSTELYRLLDSELPTDIGGLKDALSLHIHILWRLSDAKQIPRDPQEHIIRLFNSHIQSEAALYECPQGPALIPISLVEFQAAISLTARGRIQQRMRMIEEHILNYVQSLLARFGLLRWGPDFRQSTYGLYNSACRIIALDTFKQALVSHAYSTMKPNISYATDLTFLIKLYDHIVHHYLFSRYKKEVRNAGSVQAADKSNPQYRSRARLAEAREKFLLQNHYPQRYLDLIDAKTTSDDECDSEGLKENGREVYWIKKRPERSTEAEIFIRKLDHVRQQDAIIDPLKTWRERLRKVPEMDQETSAFTTLPKGIPIDYYLPSFFNQLQPRLRNMISSRQIAFLPNVSHSFSDDPDEKLNDEDFMAKHGASILERYKLDDLDDDLDDEEWLEDDDEEMYEADVSGQRDVLVARLSEESMSL